MRNVLITMIVAMFVLFTCNVTYSQTDFDIANLEKDCICTKKGDEISVTCLSLNKPSFTAEFSNRSGILVGIPQNVAQNEFMAILVLTLSGKETRKIPVILVKNKLDEIPSNVIGRRTQAYDCYVDLKYPVNMLPLSQSFWARTFITATIQTGDGINYWCILCVPPTGMFGIGMFWSMMIVIVIVTFIGYFATKRFCTKKGREPAVPRC